ncbi:MAG: GGDEF domain-containing protein [Gammaproteobacteria bacterium]|nr:GGDEF domain-containing protein [Gammaproteobacteria bacterium]
MVRPSPYINLQTIEKAIPVKIACIMISLIMLLFKNKLEASRLAQQITPYFFTSFYLFSLMSMGYVIGHLSLIAGMVMAAAPLFSIILFKDRITILLIILGAITFLTICALYIANILPYAPLFIFDAVPDQHAKLFYLYCTLFLMIPHYFSFIAATYLIVKYWQSREENYRQLSVTDNLMEMANRRGISAHLAQEKLQQTTSQPLSIILADIDFFKNVNDTFGHAIGDVVLRHVGASIKTSLRDSDHVGRYGGEEFLIVLPNTNLESARQIAERCRLIIEREIIPIQAEQHIHITTSFGVYCSTNRDEDILDMIHCADIQLYRAKENGRNRVCIPDDAEVA